MPKEVNYIFSGRDSFESKRKQNLIAQEVMVVTPMTPRVHEVARGVHHLQLE
jgi:hypothetical protein